LISKKKRGVEHKEVGQMKFPSLSLHGKILFSSSTLQAIVVIALEVVISYYFISTVSIETNAEQQGSGKSIAVYLFIFIFTQIYQLIIIIEAVWRQNTIQIFAHIIYCSCMVAFAIFQYFQIHDALDALIAFSNSTGGNPHVYDNVFMEITPYLITSIVVLGVCDFCFIYLAFKLYLEFGWKIYKKIGADPKKRAMYRSYQILIMLLKFAVYFFDAFAIQFVVLVLHPTDPEFGLTIVALAVSFPIVFLVVFALDRENKILMWIWLVLLLSIMAYFIFKIYRIYDPTQVSKYVGSGKFLTLFASLGLLAIIITFVYSCICLGNFDKGLKPHLTSKKEPNGEAGTSERVSENEKGRFMVLA